MKDEKTTAAVRSFLLLWRWWLFGYIPSIKKRAPAPACCWMLTSFYLLSCGLIFTTSSWNISLNMMKMDSPPICKKKWAFVQKLFDRMWWTLNSIRLEGFFSFSNLIFVHHTYKFFFIICWIYKVQEWYRNAEIYIKSQYQFNNTYLGSVYGIIWLLYTRILDS